jgi:hypothetical protein
MAKNGMYADLVNSQQFTSNDSDAGEESPLFGCMPVSWSSQVP